MLEWLIVLGICLGVGALVLPKLGRANKHRLESRVDFLVRRLSQTTDQLAHTTESKFPTDYKRLQQQVGTDAKELAGLLNGKGKHLPSEKLADAWSLVNQSSVLLPSPLEVTPPAALGTSAGQHLSTLAQVKHQAPEIWEVVQNIQMDDQTIRQRIEEGKLPNQQELLAVHDANMGRYRDILDGYLKIKASPATYYQSEERLAQSAEALRQFDHQLDETLKQINEGDMMNFEISLRMMKQGD